GGVRVPIEGDAATRSRIRHPGGWDLGVVGPQLLAGGRVECEQLVHRRAAVMRIADLERSPLGYVPLRNVADVEGPDALERFDVLRRDLAELRKALRALAATVSVPLTLRRRIRGIFEGNARAIVG